NSKNARSLRSGKVAQPGKRVKLIEHTQKLLRRQKFLFPCVRKYNILRFRSSSVESCSWPACSAPKTAAGFGALSDHRVLFKGVGRARLQSIDRASTGDLRLHPQQDREPRLWAYGARNR